jgi:DNA-directed RNA polymerase subunit RPC12/RpoP
MYIGEEKQTKLYYRTSKLGSSHSYERTVTYVMFVCDNCGEPFTRPRGSMSPKRLNNNYFHCCTRCDSKRFAQKKGVERRLIWDMPASSTLQISRL